VSTNNVNDLVGLTFTKKLAVPARVLPPRPAPVTSGYQKADTVYELWEHRETGETWAVRLQYGKLTGTLDVTYDLDPEAPLRTRDLPDLPYATPERGDAERAERDKHLWIVTARFTHFESATPPQWILDRQRQTRTSNRKEDKHV
jgi:hypothetical protein